MNVSITNAEWTGLATLLLLNLAAAFGLRRVPRKALLPADRVAIIAMLLSVDVLALMSVFVIDYTQCATSSGRLACLLNENQGVLALVAVLAAAATIYVNARQAQVERREKGVAQRDVAARQIASAADELAHNLQHCTYSQDDRAFWLASTTRFEETFELLKSPCKENVHPALLERLRNLRRVLEANSATIHGLSGINKQWRAVAALDPNGSLQVHPRYLAQQVEQTFSPADEDAPEGAKDGAEGRGTGSCITGERLTIRRKSYYAFRSVFDGGVELPSSIASALTKRS